MEMTNASIIGVINLINGYGNKKLPQKISFAISKNLKNFNKEYDFYQEELQKLLKNYAEYYEKESDGSVKMLPNGIPAVKEPHNKDFENELTELLSMKVDIPIYKIDAEAFNYDDEKYDVMSPMEITNLMELLCDEE